MNKSEELIYQYERARQKVSILKAERRNLISECPGQDTTDDQNGSPVSFGKLCLSDIWEDESPDDYESVLEHIGCEACNKSYQIKRGPLADAQKEFGKIKRRLSYAGKKLIKAVEQQS